MNNERPYINLYWNQLDEIFSRRNDVPEVLADLVTELAFRHRPKAIILQKEVIAKLNEITTAEYFRWPQTDAPQGKKGFSANWPEVGLLRFMGYTVGTNGIGQHRRKEILDAAFNSILPNVNTRNYMEEWGSPDTAKRLRKIAESIAAFIRNAKRSSSDMA